MSNLSGFVKSSYSPHMAKFTKQGLEKAKSKLVEFERRLAAVQFDKGRAIETGGNGWHDNFEFEQLEQEEHKLLKQIDDIKVKLGRAELATVPTGAKIISFGSTVKIELENGETRTYSLVDEFDADVVKNKISTISPLCQVLLGAKVGDKKVYKTKTGDKVIKVIGIR